MKRDPECGAIDENYLFNNDKTNFVVDLNEASTLDMKGDKNFSYADVFREDVQMTMMLFFGRDSKAYLGVPFIIFQNNRSSYPIQDVPDNVPGVWYRSRPKIKMDSCVFCELLVEKSIMKPCPEGRNFFVFSKASGLKLTEATREAIKASYTRLRFLPKISSHLCQFTDSFIIQHIKRVWRRCWD